MAGGCTHRAECHTSQSAQRGPPSEWWQGDGPQTLDWGTPGDHAGWGREQERAVTGCFTLQVLVQVRMVTFYVQICIYTCMHELYTSDGTMLVSVENCHGAITGTMDPVMFLTSTICHEIEDPCLLTAQRIPHCQAAHPQSRTQNYISPSLCPSPVPNKFTPDPTHVEGWCGKVWRLCKCRLNGM